MKSILRALGEIGINLQSQNINLFLGGNYPKLLNNVAFEILIKMKDYVECLEGNGIYLIKLNYLISIIFPS